VSDRPDDDSGPRDEITEFLDSAFATIPMSMHYITNVETDVAGDSDLATVRAMFYNPMQLPGMPDMSSCGGYYHHEMVRTPDSWRSRHLREENLWFVNPPMTQP
jgi:hypothetical protein